MIVNPTICTILTEVAQLAFPLARRDHCGRTASVLGSLPKVLGRSLSTLSTTGNQASSVQQLRVCEYSCLRSTLTAYIVSDIFTLIEDVTMLAECSEKNQFEICHSALRNHNKVGTTDTLAVSAPL